MCIFYPRAPAFCTITTIYSRSSLGEPRRVKSMVLSPARTIPKEEEEEEESPAGPTRFPTPALRASAARGSSLDIKVRIPPSFRIIFHTLTHLRPLSRGPCCAGRSGRTDKTWSSMGGDESGGVFTFLRRYVLPRSKNSRV